MFYSKSIILTSELKSLKTSYLQLEPVKLRCPILGTEVQVDKLKFDLEAVKSDCMQTAKEKSSAVFYVLLVIDFYVLPLILFYNFLSKCQLFYSG
jgi:hypothetical protein